MAWTTPATAVTGDVIPASFWNTNGRDNLNALHDVLTGAAQGFGSIFYPTSDSLFALQKSGGSVLLQTDSGDYIGYDRAGNTYSFNIGSSPVLNVYPTLVGTEKPFRVHVNGPAPYAGAGAALFGWNRSNGQAEVNIYNDFTNPANVVEFLYYNGSAWVVAATLSKEGKLSGAGFFDSGQVAVGPGTNVNVAHGFGKRPRFLFGYYSVTINLVSNDTSNVSVMPSPATTTSVCLLAADLTNIVLQNTSGSTTYYCRVFAML